MREMSLAALDDIFAQSTSTTYLHLLRIEVVDNSGQDVVYYFVDNYEAVESGGIVYQPAAFTVQLGKAVSDQLPTVTLAFDSGDRQVINQLRAIDAAPKVYVSVVAAERPDDLLIEDIEYIVENWTVSAAAVNMTLTLEPILNEPISGDLITPAIFPLLWENISISGDPSELELLPEKGDDGGGTGGGGGGGRPIGPPPDYVIQPPEYPEPEIPTLPPDSSI